ncbi:hypothetical protein FNF27_00092 [Cafeteria roenbergensis]|uniref:EF-hand domain-containing protein n=1 Tax=Cafeteria roenbergensis TaxID=33653 RepID=A0A5A8EME5_CAFRO|nr:hypothetical protein FNF29_03453 [Cafeteria roenbergensis]KAA0164277.1 hypothetical protein FNF31_02511 [Cafeteria roenbergensis]KAA0168694.1 hypothetical protein FNF28_02433 [Cafeteria roenbergensis]KAA0178238.1 hypothetical protein FNF27_00092 [Cafeteria roenbergensis]|eukprot:KAA0152929.1 hypothetical protein FNF29_03453 [Cafeteria roenbergensis]
MAASGASVASFGDGTAVPEAELETLQAIFAEFDTDGSGAISTRELEHVFERLGRDPAEADAMLRDVDPDRSGLLTFQEFVDLLVSARGSSAPDGPDAKVLEFLRILEEYRIKCEGEGSYLEAERATNQLSTLRKQEERRVLRALKARHAAERQDVVIANNMQFAEFTSAWDKYLEEYDRMAEMYIKQMTERHRDKLRVFQESLNEEMARAPPKYSKELLDWRKREALLAKQKKYGEAQKVKRIADELELRERTKMDDDKLGVLKQRETRFRAQQDNELSALLKRIDARRREHLKQLEIDSKRLKQRNKNVIAVLESKQSVEFSKMKSKVKMDLQPRRIAAQAKRAQAAAAAGASGGHPGADESVSGGDPADFDAAASASMPRAPRWDEDHEARGGPP